jgi:probable phosphoglycerate mutase
MRLLLVRHGETKWSRSSRQTGRTDLALTKEGIRESQGLRQVFRALKLEPSRFTRIYCSPARRARETFALLEPAVDAAYCELLHEIDFGEIEGWTPTEVRLSRPGWDIWRDGCPGGESVADLGQRADRFLECCTAADGDYLVITHGLMLRVLAVRALALPPECGASLHVATASLGIIADRDGRRVITHWNLSVSLLARSSDTAFRDQAASAPTVGEQEVCKE